jgi:hypothetical protein
VWIALLAALAAATPGDRFVPPVERDGARAIVPLVFTDGTRARLSYPARLRLAERGVEPYGSGTLRGGDGRDFAIRYGRVADVVAGWKKLADYEGIGFYDSGPGEDDVDFLVFRFGHWVVLVYDYPPEFDGASPMPEADRSAWARSLRGRVTRSGFLRLRGRGRLQLARAGEHAGPQLKFGPNLGLILTPGRCRRTAGQDRRVAGRWVAWSGRYATWCVSRSMRADAYGTAVRRRALIRGLRLDR